MNEQGRSAFARLADNHDRVVRRMKPVGAQLAEQFNGRWRDQIAAIANPITEAQRAQIAALANPITEAQRAQIAALANPITEAQRAQIAALARPTFEPLMRSILQSETEFTTLSRLMTQANTDAFRRLADFGLTYRPDVVGPDDETVEEIWSAVSEVVDSPGVREMLRDFDPSKVGEADAEEARKAAESALDDEATKDIPLTVGQMVALLSALYLLVTAAVASAYGYDVGVVTDVIGWPLAALGFYSFLAEIQRRR